MSSRKVWLIVSKWGTQSVEKGYENHPPSG